MKIRPVGAELFHADRRTDSRYTQFCERNWSWNLVRATAQTKRFRCTFYRDFLEGDNLQSKLFDDSWQADYRM